jgi:hypothetical protein
VWDGEAYLQPAVGSQIRLCKSDVTCSAFTIEDASTAEAYTEQAQAALREAGFSTRRARQMLEEDCLAPVSVNYQMVDARIACSRTATSCNADQARWELTCNQDRALTWSGVCFGASQLIEVPLNGNCILSADDEAGDGWAGCTGVGEAFRMDIPSTNWTTGGVYLQSAKFGEMIFTIGAPLSTAHTSRMGFVADVTPADPVVGGSFPPPLPPSPLPPAPPAYPDVPNCYESAMAAGVCTECIKDGFMIAPVDNACVTCPALSDCIGEVHCRIDDETDELVSECADVEVTFQLADYSIDHGHFVYVLGTFNDWGDKFSRVGFEAYHQWRLSKVTFGEADLAALGAKACEGRDCTEKWAGTFFVPRGQHEYRYGEARDPNCWAFLGCSEEQGVTNFATTLIDVEPLCDTANNNIRGDFMELLWYDMILSNLPGPGQAGYNIRRDPAVVMHARGFDAQPAGSAGVNPQIALPIHPFTGCAPYYPAGTGLNYVDVEVTVDASHVPSGLQRAQLITGFTGGSAIDATDDQRAGHPLTEVPGEPGFYRGTVRVLRGRETQLLVESFGSEPEEGLWNEDDGAFNGQICQWFHSVVPSYNHVSRRPTRKLYMPEVGGPTSVNLCFGDCHELEPCPCPVGTYRDGLECSACIVPADCDWPYATCTSEDDGVCGIKPGDKCGNDVRTLQINFAVFGETADATSVPTASPSFEADCPDCFTGGAGLFCRCIAEKLVETLNAGFANLSTNVIFELANYQEYLNKPKLWDMEMQDMAELIKLESNRNVMIRPGMINLAVAQDVGGPAGTTWIAGEVDLASRPVAIFKSDQLDTGAAVLLEQVGHVVGFPRVAGGAAGQLRVYGEDKTGGDGTGCELHLSYTNYAEPSCHGNYMGSWDKAGCSVEESYFGFNSAPPEPGNALAQHGENFNKILECFAYDSSNYSPDCTGGVLDAAGCVAGQCIGSNQCHCDIGWRAVRGACSVCDWGYQWSDLFDACIETGSMCTHSECHDPAISCAPGCSDLVRGDGICQEACNTEECAFDAGDCSGEYAAGEGLGWASAHCHNKWIGDGVCDRACYQHNGDGGDCDASPAVCAAGGEADRRRLRQASELPAPAARAMADVKRDAVSGRALHAKPQPVDYSSLVSVYPAAAQDRLLF